MVLAGPPGAGKSSCASRLPAGIPRMHTIGFVAQPIMSSAKVDSLSLTLSTETPVYDSACLILVLRKWLSRRAALSTMLILSSAKLVYQLLWLPSL